MFAVKCLSRYLSPRLQSSLTPKYKHNISRLSQAWIVSGSPYQHNGSLHACFSCSTNFAAAANEVLGKPISSLAESVTVPSEPDVLYHMIEVEIRSSDRAVLVSYNRAISLTAENLGLTISHNEVGAKPHIRRWTVLKSRHVHRKHGVQYEVRTYHHKIKLERLTGSTADTFLEYIQRNLPEGVSMRVCRARMEKLPDHLLTPPSPVEN
ncbi:28S ribosomal protein S10, mitochondrial [Frankliniella occidentalis]|uniref:Small ribosomal subunit protein uS10m n=1 Tax=Frankliniella occidentalis TaxID=133901 RepID=A0A6J1SLH5_FRAOC|nr:28S ribosomal protein S10, mitochondrial [Frankliniella occidentalis]